jgi:hypothetical protein
MVVRGAADAKAMEQSKLEWRGEFARLILKLGATLHSNQ